MEEIRASDDKKGDKRADFLVKVFMKNGSEEWLLVHLEVQAYFETGFAERMFIYFYRTLDRFQRKVIACAVYVNDRIPKKFDSYEYNFHGTTLHYTFNTFKVIDYKNQEDALEKNPNIFALVTLACLYVIKTKKGENAAKYRKTLKFRLISLMLKRGYSRKEVIDLFAFFRIILTLPKHLENEFNMQVSNINQATKEEYPEVPQDFIDWVNSLPLFANGQSITEFLADRDKVVAKAKAEAMKLAKAEATKAKAEAMKLAKAEATKAKAEAMKLAKVEATKAKVEAMKLAKAEATKAKVEAMKLAKVEKELEAEKSALRLHKKLNLDAATIADVLGREIKWVEKILKKGLKKG